jgi:hypothetical protein
VVDDSMFCTTADCQKNITNHHRLIPKSNKISIIREFPFVAMGIQIINNNHINQSKKRQVQKFTKLKEDAHFHKNEPFPLRSLLRHLMAHKTSLSKKILPKETNYLNQVKLNSMYARFNLMDP